MIEKIRISFWDIYTFFLSGFMLTIYIICFALIYKHIEPSELADYFIKLPATIIIFAAPLTFTLFGMLLEPFANLFDALILSKTIGRFIEQNKSTEAQSKLLETEISSHLLGPLSGKINNPYHICKEYVESKQLSSTFMVFLSRYGFYRNCSFLSFISIFACIIPGLSANSVACALGFFICTLVFKKRSSDFYYYQAPSIYSAFLIDKINWNYSNDT